MGSSENLSNVVFKTHSILLSMHMVKIQKNVILQHQRTKTRIRSLRLVLHILYYIYQ